MSRMIPPPLTKVDRLRSVLDTGRSRKRQQHWSGPFAAKRIHLIGIGGCGMSSLGGVLLRCGAVVSGSDLREFAGQDRLEEMGATIRIGQAPVNIARNCDLVVYSAAVRDDNPELLEARRRIVPCIKYAEMLGQVMRLRNGYAIAGTHGKSTTTALLAYILRTAGLDPTFVVGAGVPQLSGGSGVGDGPDMIVEACEFDRSFLNLAPKYAAILNIEEDHLDCFESLSGIIEAFRAFASLVPPDGVIIANAEDRNVAAALESVGAPVESFGFAQGADWRATNVTHDLGRYRFDLRRRGEAFARVEIDGLYGRHQVLNSMVAAALAHRAGVEPGAIVDAIRSFKGADRRLTHKGEVGGVLILDDYGHHPTEIQVTLRAVCERYPNRRLWVVFQPHQHSRTRFLLNDFARSFGLASKLIVPDIYFVRDSAELCDLIRAEDLVSRVHANGGDATHLPKLDDITDHLTTAVAPGDIVLTMGAGDVWKVSDELVRRLS